MTLPVARTLPDEMAGGAVNLTAKPKLSPGGKGFGGLLYWMLTKLPPGTVVALKFAGTRVPEGESMTQMLASLIVDPHGGSKVNFHESSLLSFAVEFGLLFITVTSMVPVVPPSYAFGMIVTTGWILVLMGMVS